MDCEPPRPATGVSLGPFGPELCVGECPQSLGLGKLFARHRDHLGPAAAESWKFESEHEFPGPLGPGAPKVENGVEKESESTVFQLL